MSEPYCYFFGYGSLLYSHGYKGRGLRNIPDPDEMVHLYTINGYKRGMFGIWRVYGRGLRSFFGIVKDKNSEVVGSLAPIKTRYDLFRLLLNEGAIASTSCIIPVYKTICVGRYNNKKIFSLLSSKTWVENYNNVQPMEGYLKRICENCDKRYIPCLSQDIGDVIEKWGIR